MLHLRNIRHPVKLCPLRLCGGGATPIDRPPALRLCAFVKLYNSLDVLEVPLVVVIHPRRHSFVLFDLATSYGVCTPIEYVWFPSFVKAPSANTKSLLLSLSLVHRFNVKKHANHEVTMLTIAPKVACLLRQSNVQAVCILRRPGQWLPRFWFRSLPSTVEQELDICYLPTLIYNPQV